MMHSHATSRKVKEGGSQENTNCGPGGADKVTAYMDYSSHEELVVHDAHTPMLPDTTEVSASGDPTLRVENGATLLEGAALGAVLRSCGEPGGLNKEQNLMQPIGKISLVNSELVDQGASLPRHPSGMRTSKKRPREGLSMNQASSTSLGRGIESQPNLEVPSRSRSQEGNHGRGVGVGFHDSIGEEGQGGIPTAPAKSQHSPHSQREVIGASREGVLKAFNDPKTMEVVLQDFETGEIRRVRREEMYLSEEERMTRAAHSRVACNNRGGMKDAGDAFDPLREYPERSTDGSTLPSPISRVVNGIETPLVRQHQSNGKRVEMERGGNREGVGDRLVTGGRHQNQPREEGSCGVVAMATGASRMHPALGNHTRQRIIGSGAAGLRLERGKENGLLVGSSPLSVVNDGASGALSPAGVLPFGKGTEDISSGSAVTTKNEVSTSEPVSVSRLAVGRGKIDSFLLSGPSQQRLPAAGAARSGSLSMSGLKSDPGQEFVRPRGGTGGLHGDTGTPAGTGSVTLKAIDVKLLHEGKGSKGKGRANMDGPVGENPRGEGKSISVSDGTVNLASASTRPRALQCPDHASPNARTFFDFDTISTFEMRMLPEFFTGRSVFRTPETYIESRNYMVRTYQRMVEDDRTGGAYLTLTECRRNLAGDTFSLTRIHQFLDQFGLINTLSDSKRPPSYPIPPSHPNLWVFPRNSAGRISPCEASTVGAGSTLGGVQQGALGRPRAELRGARHGVSVSGDSTAIGTNPATGTTTGESSSLDGWDKRQDMQLLEAALTHPDHWDLVAQQLGGGYSAAECMRRFLNLAVEETLAFKEEKPTHAEESSGLLPETRASAVTIPTSRVSAGVSGSQILGTSGSATAEGPGAASAVANAEKGSATAPSPSFANDDSTPGSGFKPDGTLGGDTTISQQTPVITPSTTLGSPSGQNSNQVAPGGHGGNPGPAAAAGPSRRTGGIVSGGRSPVHELNENYPCSGYRSNCLGPVPPALMLASRLISSVHPEVLASAMSAATATVEKIKRDSANAWLGKNGQSNKSVSEIGLHGADVPDQRTPEVKLQNPASYSAATSLQRSQSPSEYPQAIPTNAPGQEGICGATSSSGMGSKVEAGVGAGTWAGVDGEADMVDIERRAAYFGAARAAVLSAAALQARGLAEIEKRRAKELMADLIEARLQRIETKVNYLEQLDKMLEMERQSREHERAERLAEEE